MWADEHNVSGGGGQPPPAGAGRAASRGSGRLGSFLARRARVSPTRRNSFGDDPGSPDGLSDESASPDKKANLSALKNWTDEASRKAVLALAIELAQRMRDMVTAKDGSALQRAKRRAKFRSEPVSPIKELLLQKCRESVKIIAQSIAVLVVPQLTSWGAIFRYSEKEYRRKGESIDKFARRLPALLRQKSMIVRASSSLMVMQKDFVTATNKLDAIVRGVDTLYSRMMGEWGKAFVSSVRNVVSNLAFEEMERFGRPMKQLFGRFEKFDEMMNEAFVPSEDAIGVKWREDRVLTKPAKDRIVSNEQLQRKLEKGILQFSLDELASFGARGLMSDSRVQAGGRWFRPVEGIAIYVKGCHYGNRLKRTTHMRAVRAGLTMVSNYEVHMSGLHFTPAAMWQALAMSSQELRRDENELSYMITRLDGIESIVINQDTWRTYVKAWDALLELRSKIQVERGHSVLRAIVSDLKVMEGLGAASQMLTIAGAPPDEVLTMLEQGPEDHIHRHAFRYRQLLERELFGIRRVKELKVGALGLISGAVVAAMIGFFDNLFAILFEIALQRYDVVRERD